MGTGKPGRYLNTKGSGRTVSDFAVVHSQEGRFVKTLVKVDGKKQHILRLAAGGHGQSGMDLLDKYGSTRADNGICLADLMRRPELGYEQLAPVDTWRPDNLDRKQKEAVETEIKYEGYIKRQIREAERFAKLESKKIPADTDYYAITGIRAETKQKLSQIKPESIGQASRISGVSPADIQVLMIYFGIT
jgi:tRNA uridine 5-carboxymethylaminomethyl modification enzyme